MARSEPAQVDVELRVGQLSINRLFLSVDEVIALLSDCTRMRSLRLLGPRRDVCAVLEVLCTTTPIHSLSLSLWEPGPPVILPEDLFGGQAPVRRINFTANKCIVAPRWLLCGITHFTSGEQILLPDLLDALCQMPALEQFTLQHCRAFWEDASVPREPPIEMPHLKVFSVHADSPRYFALLHQRLTIPRGAKRRLELRTLAVNGWSRWERWFTLLLPIFEAANGLQHVYLSGGVKDGTFRTWTGDADTAHEDAEFFFEMYWYGSPTSALDDQSPTSPIFHLGGLCDLLGATKHGRGLVLEEDLTPTRSELPALCWWRLLEKLPAVEKLEVHGNVVKALYAAWEETGAPPVLPALQQIQFVAVDTATTIAALRSPASPVRKGFISRIVPFRVARGSNSPPRTIVSTPMTNETDVLPPAVQLPGLPDEILSEGLITLLQGGAGLNLG